MLKNLDPIVIAYFLGALFSYILGPFETKLLQATIGASIAIGFPILIMGADVRSLLKIRCSEFLSMTMYALIICLISIVSIISIGKYRDFSTQVLLLSSSFIGSSPNLFLSAMLLDIPINIQLKAQALDWIGSSSLFVFLMLVSGSRKKNNDQQEKAPISMSLESFSLIPKASLVAVICFSIRETAAGSLKDFASLLALVILSVAASAYTKSSMKKDAIKLSSLVFVVYAASVGMLFQIQKIANLSTLELLYPIALIALSYFLLSGIGRFFSGANRLATVVVSSSVLSPMIAALVIAKLRGEEEIPLSLRLSILGLLSACFYSLLIHWVVSVF